MSTTYRAVAERSGDWWAISVPELPGVFTQTKALARAKAMATEAIALMLDVDPNTVIVQIDVHLPENLETEVAEARSASAAAELRQLDAARRAREVVHKLKKAGLTGADVAAALGVSPQRVSQLSKG
jgi:predicted RNase H-like HicB family nuclease